ncbi:hypothetical protein NL676_014471 [Syzygium grande]|nr:hypothetical protein NL676_014471 [Syzygium grande]
MHGGGVTASGAACSAVGTAGGGDVGGQRLGSNGRQRALWCDFCGYFMLASWYDSSLRKAVGKPQQGYFMTRLSGGQRLVLSTRGSNNGEEWWDVAM